MHISHVRRMYSLTSCPTSHLCVIFLRTGMTKGHVHYTPCVPSDALQMNTFILLHDARVSQDLQPMPDRAIWGQSISVYELSFSVRWFIVTAMLFSQESTWQKELLSREWAVFSQLLLLSWGILSLLAELGFWQEGICLHCNTLF